MKKILVIILGVVLFTSCINDSTFDYRDMSAVVVVKRGLYMGYKIKIRYCSTLDNKHIFKNLFVPECEFNLYNIGDTIK